MDAESVVYALKLSPEAQERLRAAAGFHQDHGYQDMETPEPELRRITRRFTGQEFDDLVQSSEITSRRPYGCVICGEAFSLTDYNETRLAARIAGEPHPFQAGRQTHVGCQPQP